MKIRTATIDDIPQIMLVRNSVKENKLSHPDAVTAKDCEEFLLQKGKGWVCEIDHKVVGFSMVDLKNKNVWALFLNPNFEKKGIGRKLHYIMLDWYFSQTKENIWLGTSPKTRAEIFYRKSGWKEIGIHGDGEIKFEMTFDNWKNHS